MKHNDYSPSKNAEELTPKYPDFIKERVLALCDATRWWYEYRNQDDGVLISQIATSKPVERRGGTQKPPYAFTENGVAMQRKYSNATRCH